jgi:glycosyltransferase involved in cell wall biosynthesis
MPVENLNTYFEPGFAEAMDKIPSGNQSTSILKSVLVITQYYPPEIGGGSQRSSGIVEGLKQLGVEVTVIAPFPTYLMRDHERVTPWKFWEEQKIAGVRIIRSYVLSTNRNNFIKRIGYYISFALSAFINGWLHMKKTDVIITICPPLLTGITGVLLKRLKGAKLMVDIGDLWPEFAIQLGLLKNKSLIKISKKIEDYIYRSSDALNLVTEKTYDLVRQLHPYLAKTFYNPNFVDTNLIYKIPKDAALSRKFNLEGKTVIGYAGNIGCAQGFGIISEAAKLLKGNKEVVFFIIGHGVDAVKLNREIVISQLDNIVLSPPISRGEISRYLALFDFAVIPLLKIDVSLITIPSKIYTCMAAELPILLCIDGESRQIIEKADAGIFVEPENAAMLVDKINFLIQHKEAAAAMGKQGREYVKNHFDQSVIISKLMNDLESIL